MPLASRDGACPVSAAIGDHPASVRCRCRRRRGRPRLYQSFKWIRNRITVAIKGTARPARRFPADCETIPTSHGNTAGPRAAIENMIAPTLRAATPKRWERRATVIGYTAAKLKPVIRALAITPDTVEVR